MNYQSLLYGYVTRLTSAPILASVLARLHDHSLHVFLPNISPHQFRAAPDAQVPISVEASANMTRILEKLKVVAELRGYLLEATLARPVSIMGTMARLRL